MLLLTADDFSKKYKICFQMQKIRNLTIEKIACNYRSYKGFSKMEVIKSKYVVKIGTHDVYIESFLLSIINRMEHFLNKNLVGDVAFPISSKIVPPQTYIVEFADCNFVFYISYVQEGEEGLTEFRIIEIESKDGFKFTP